VRPDALSPALSHREREKIGAWLSAGLFFTQKKADHGVRKSSRWL
jgi:hypothetical protein